MNLNEIVTDLDLYKIKRKLGAESFSMLVLDALLKDYSFSSIEDLKTFIVENSRFYEEGNMRVEKKKKVDEMMKFRQGIYTADTTNGVQYYGTEEYSDLKYMEEVDPVEFFETLDSLDDDRAIYTVFGAGEQPLWKKINKTFGINESSKRKRKMRKEKKEDVIELKDDLVLTQEGKKVVLEKGDSFRILKESIIGDFEDQENYNYYKSQIDQIATRNYSDMSFKVSSPKGETNWMDINELSIDAFLEGVQH